MKRISKFTVYCVACDDSDEGPLSEIALGTHDSLAAAQASVPVPPDAWITPEPPVVLTLSMYKGMPPDDGTPNADDPENYRDYVVEDAVSEAIDIQVGKRFWSFIIQEVRDSL